VEAAERIRQAAVDYASQLSMDELADRLDLLPSGARMLIERKVWPLEESVRVADSLGIALTLEVDQNDHA
jgi:hypothetical protein